MLRLLRHIGSECDLCGLMEMAAPPLQRARVALPATCVVSRAPVLARDLPSVTPVPLDPIVGGALEDASAILVS
jgi:hypothetical protein